MNRVSFRGDSIEKRLYWTVKEKKYGCTYRDEALKVFARILDAPFMEMELAVHNNCIEIMTFPKELTV